MIELKNINLTFNQGTPLETSALSDVNLKIEEGEFLTIIGGNGAGKSTLLNILSGDLLPNSGQILIDGKDVTRKPTSTRAEYVSRVFQDPMLGTCADLSIEDNLALALKRGDRRALKTALNEKVRDLFKKSLKELGIGLEGRLKDPMGSLSGGQRQAVSLLMATLKPSKILLLDEHTAALDPKMARKVLELSLSLIEKQKLTVLMITHHMSFALEYGNRTVLMQEGRIERDFKGDERAGLQPKDLLALFEL